MKKFIEYLKFRNEFYNLILTPEERKILKDYQKQQKAGNLLPLKTLCLTIWSGVFILILLFICKITAEPVIVYTEQTVVNNYQPNNYQSIEVATAKDITIDDAVKYAKTINAKRITEVAFEMKEKYNLPLYVIFALIDTESEFYRTANSPLGKSSGRGLLQVSEICLKDFNNKSGQKVKTVNDLYYIYDNMNIGCWYFSRLYNLKSIYTYSQAYIAYNVGIGNYEKYKYNYLNNYMPDGSKYNALKRYREKEKYYYAVFNGL